MNPRAMPWWAEGGRPFGLQTEIGVVAFSRGVVDGRSNPSRDAPRSPWPSQGVVRTWRVSTAFAERMHWRLGSPRLLIPSLRGGSTAITEEVRRYAIRERRPEPQKVTLDV
jgi:hypothetical protein